ncbi:MAG TPA: hypothetical protein VG370_00755 [Chloroflexota bacterium]|jgi:hypothetical protein|nr:hypothetical protein [Chloroflexota bacterium]
MRSAKSRAPRLIALLIDLPDPARAALAERWRISDGAHRRGWGAASGAGSTRELYAAMVDPERLAARVAGLEPACRDVLRGLASEPAGLDDLLGRVALGSETVERCLSALGGLGLVVRVEPNRRARLAVAPFGSALLAVPREVAAALRLVGVTR